MRINPNADRLCLYAATMRCPFGFTSRRVRMNFIISSGFAISFLAAAAGTAFAADGQQIYNQNCGLCHNMISPKLGDKAAWAWRQSQSFRRRYPGGSAIYIEQSAIDPNRS